MKLHLWLSARCDWE